MSRGNESSAHLKPLLDVKLKVQDVRGFSVAPVTVRKALEKMIAENFIMGQFSGKIDEVRLG